MTKPCNMLLLAAASALALVATPSHALPTTHSRRQTTNENAGNCAAGNTACPAVANAINKWTTDVNQVNVFLNDDANLTGAALQSSVATTLGFADDEPTELGILMMTPGLSAAGQAAAMTLMQVFGNVPQDLMMIMTGQVSALDGINDINAVRCPLILPAITTLWTESAAAVGLPPPQPAGLPNACNEPNFGIN